MSEQVHLNNNTIWQLFNTYLEKAQSVGTFTLEEVPVIKTSLEVCTHTSSVIPFTQACENLVKALHKGQAKGGCFSLNDAYNIVQMIVYLQANASSLEKGKLSTANEVHEVHEVQSQGGLSELSEPVPLTDI